MIAVSRNARRGVTPVEVLVLVLIVSAVAMFVLTIIPRSRDSARLNGCNANLMRIGEAMIQSDAAQNHLPGIPPAGQPGPGPLAELAQQFGLAWFEGGTLAKAPAPGPIPPRRVQGFVCLADPHLIRPDPDPAPVSYRANAGPGATGTGGPFAFGATTSIRDAEKAAGQDFTAAFAERLMGSGTAIPSVANDYRSLNGPLGDEPCAGGDWRGDAGSSWASSGWRSTLYNHTLKPNETPSCIAADGKTARMGASSLHENRVNVLMLGGSVRGFTSRVDRLVWRKFGGTSK